MPGVAIHMEKGRPIEMKRALADAVTKAVTAALDVPPVDPRVYAVLAESGFFPVDKLESHYQNGSDLSGHVSHKNVPGVEFSTGSLGHGLGVSAGMAYSMKLRPGARSTM